MVFRILLAAFSIALIVFGFLPWLELDIHFLEKMIKGLNSDVLQYIGFQLPEFHSTYSAADLFTLGTSLSSLTDIAKTFDISTRTIRMGSYGTMAISISWAIGALLLVIGTIITLVGKKRSSIVSVIGCVVIILVCVAVSVPISEYSTYIEGGIGLMLSLFGAVLVIILTAVTRLFYLKA